MCSVECVLNYLSCLIVKYPILQIVFTGLVSGLVAFITVYGTSKYNKQQFEEECRLRDKELIKEQNKYQNELNLRKYEKLLNDLDKLKLVDKMITILNERELDIENKPMVFTSITSESLARGDIYKDVKILSVIARSLGIDDFSLNTSDFVEYVLNFKFENSISTKYIGVYNKYAKTVYLSGLDYVQKYSFNEFIIQTNENTLSDMEIGKYLRILMDLLNLENIFDETYLGRLKCFYDIERTDKGLKVEINIKTPVLDQEKVTFLINSINEYIGHYSKVFNELMRNVGTNKEITLKEFERYSNYIKCTNIINHILYNFRFVLEVDEFGENTRFVFFNQLVSINEF